MNSPGILGSVLILILALAVSVVFVWNPNALEREDRITGLSHGKLIKANPAGLVGRTCRRGQEVPIEDFPEDKNIPFPWSTRETIPNDPLQRTSIKPCDRQLFIWENYAVLRHAWSRRSFLWKSGNIFDGYASHVCCADHGWSSSLIRHKEIEASDWPRNLLNCHHDPRALCVDNGLGIQKGAFSCIAGLRGLPSDNDQRQK